MFNLPQLFSRSNDFHPPSKRSSRRRRLSASGQGLEQLEDRQLLTANVQMIDVNTNGLGSYPRDFTAINNTLLFSAQVERSFSRLFTTDGTEAGTVELYPIEIGSRLVNVGGTVFFGGGAGGQTELWKTDGTVAGTVLVKDINPRTSPDGATTYGSFSFLSDERQRNGVLSCQ